MPRKDTTGEQPPAPPMIDKRVMIECRHDFSADDLRYLGLELAGVIRRMVHIEDEKASVVADYAAQLKAARQEANETSIRIQTGYEMRPVECDVHYSTPQRGYKQIVRADSGKVVSEEPMTAAEMQTVLEFSQSGPDKKVQ